VDFDFAKRFWNLATKLIAEGKIIPHPVKKSKGGLDELANGIAQLKKESASAFKWVFNI
jgi:threonine dehydrogenase-like Zn-dependent dehydrogenase